MPEGDSVFQLAHRMQFMVGRTVTKTSLRVPSVATVSLNGLMCTKVWPYGKHLFMQFGDQILQTHLRMEGMWAAHPVGAKWRAPGYTARVVLQLDGDPAVEVVGHNLGLVRVFPAVEYPSVVEYLGPDLLAADFDEGEAIRRIVAQPDVTIGEALLDQRNLAGIGNEYRAEICFLSGIHPAVKVGELLRRDPDSVARIVQLSRRLLWANRNSSVRVSTGVKRAGETSYVFGRNHKPCRRCQTLIVSAELGSPPRIIWWCPTCQPGGDAAGFLGA